MVRAGDFINDVLHGWCTQQTPHCAQRARILRRTGHDSQRFCHWRRLRQRDCLCVGQGQAIIPTENGHSSHVESTDKCEQSKREGFLQVLGQFGFILQFGNNIFSRNLLAKFLGEIFGGNFMAHNCPFRSRVERGFRGAKRGECDFGEMMDSWCC